MAALRTALFEVGEPHMLIGGTAVILRGVARVTDDIEATVWAEHLDVEHLLAVLARHEIVGRIPDAAASPMSGRSFSCGIPRRRRRWS
jgi:hypothetical protein